MRASVAFAGVALAIAFACLESVLSQAVEASDSLQKAGQISGLACLRPMHYHCCIAWF